MTVNRTLNGSGVLLLDGLDVPEDDAVETILPHWILKLYLALVVIGGVVANLILICLIVRSSSRWRKNVHCSGLMVTLLQLAAADIGTLTLLAPVEVWVLKTPEGLWEFTAEYCPVFMGLEVVLSLATVYLLVALSLHAVTVTPAPVTESSSCGVVSRMAVPLTFVWLLAVSLSIPEFYLSETVLPRPGYELCTILDNNYERRSVFHVVVAVFRVAIPILVLLTTSVLSAIKLCGESTRSAPASAKRHILRISLVLTLSYAAMSLQRSLFAALYTLVPRNATAGPDAFREPPLASVATSPTASLVCSMVHFLLSAVRPVLCFVGSRHIQTTLVLCSTTRSNRPR